MIALRHPAEQPLRRCPMCRGMFRPRWPSSKHCSPHCLSKAQEKWKVHSKARKRAG